MPPVYVARWTPFYYISDMKTEIWKVTVAIEGYDMLFYKVRASSKEEAESEIGWRMEWLEDVQWSVVDAVKCNGMVYGE